MNNNKTVPSNLPQVFSSHEELEVFSSQIELFSKLHNTTTTFVLDVWNNAKLLGVSDFSAAMSMFHNIDGKASLKGKIAHALIVERGILIEPAEIIKSAEIQYYYLNADLKEVLDKYVKYMLEKMSNQEQQTSFNNYVQHILKLNLVTEAPRDTEGNIEKGWIKTAIPVTVGYAVNTQNQAVPIFERVTILQGKRKIGNKIITRFASYKLSTAISLGLYLDKNNAIKKNWHHIERMMYRRCFDTLLDILGIEPSILAMFDNNSWENDDDINAELAEDGDFSVGYINQSKEQTTNK